MKVQTGGTLGGSGTLLGNVDIHDTLSAGNSPGQLTFASNLELFSTSRSVFELNTPGVVGVSGSGGNDLVVVQGTLTLGGTLDVRVGAAGYYRLFDYATLASGSTFAAETVIPTNAGFTQPAISSSTPFPVR